MPIMITGHGRPSPFGSFADARRGAGRVQARRLWRARLRDPICSARRDHRLAIRALPQQRTDAAQNAAVESIGKNRLQAVADFDAVAMILDGQEQHDAFVLALFADAPLAEQIVG